MWLLTPAPVTPRRPSAAPSSAARRHQSAARWSFELALLALLYACYMAARAVMGVHAGVAEQRGHEVLHLETLAHLDIERPLNALLASVPPLGLLFAYLYATLHYVVTPAVLVWLAARRREGYRPARNALLVATVIGLVGYWLLPTAPPRLLGAGFTDTMATFSGVGWWGEAASTPRGMEGLSNQYAALPSLHVGWAVWVALCLYRHTNSRFLRRWVWTYPALMTVVVMATANHYLVDALAGIACAGLGSWLAHRVHDRRVIAAARQDPTLTGGPREHHRTAAPSDSACGHQDHDSLDTHRALHPRPRARAVAVDHSRPGGAVNPGHPAGIVGRRNVGDAAGDTRDGHR
jgi:hypothetical protein